MLKKIFIGIGLIGVIIIGLFVFGAYYFKSDKNVIINFIRDHPSKSAIILQQDSEILASLNSNVVMPLASTVKIIHAIEYAHQAADGSVNPDEWIDLDEVNSYYVKNTDGGAHPNWLDSVDDLKNEGKIPLREIAKGMIRFSSNANTEWLADKLGLKNLNNRLDSLGLEDHEEIYHIVSALFVGKHSFPGIKGRDLVRSLREMTMEDYIISTNEIHEILKKNSSYKTDLGDLGMSIQNIWSNNLPGGTVSEYVSIVEKINSRSYFKPDVEIYLAEVMESAMKSPANQKLFIHAGMKGGSTAFVLTKALYATNKNNISTELVYFFDKLNPIESQRVRMSMNDFELQVLTNPDFRDQVKSTLEMVVD